MKSKEVLSSGVVDIYQLSGQYQLMIENSGTENILKIISPTGELKVSIKITPDGPVLYFGMNSISIQTSGPLKINAEYLAIQTEKGINLSSQGDIELNTKGQISTTGSAQNISAKKGNVNIKANDDVKLDGERIRMNC